MVEASEGAPNGPTVHIQNAVRQRTYFCLGNCGDTVTPVQGDDMPWHYRHRENSDCPYRRAHQGEGWRPPRNSDKS
jgi:hypothetical protein